MSHLCGDDIVLWPRWPGKLLHRSRAKSGRLAKLARWAVPFIFLCAVPEIGLAAAIDCSPVKPSNGTDTNIEDNFKRACPDYPEIARIGRDRKRL